MPEVTFPPIPFWLTENSKVRILAPYRLAENRRSKLRELGNKVRIRACCKFDKFLAMIKAARAFVK